ncbi:TolC family protein [Singulisphaera sp. PoT]|uniref:TolC family protein n=1 Tax=Singulisphaera sp. PoT TaxID=3411797 RepID=UPI003BF4B96B
MLRRVGLTLSSFGLILSCLSCGCMLQRHDLEDREPKVRISGTKEIQAQASRSSDSRKEIDLDLVRTSDLQLESPPREGDVANAAGRITLEQALAMASQSSPALAQARASVDVARGNLKVTDSGFYPTVQGNYAFQAYSSQTGFSGTPVGGRFPILPVRGFGPGTQEFSVSEAQLKYTIFQFGKQWNKHRQATWKEEVARLENERSCQTVAYEVTSAYFQVLEARSAVETATRAVERAEEFAKEAADTLRRGVITQEENLRAQAALATMRQGLTDAKSEEEVAVAGLNRVMGINVNAPTRVVERRVAPELHLELDEALRLAVDNRREVAVVQRGVAIAQGDVNIARADFLPTVSVQAAFSNITGTRVQNANVGAGGIFLSQDLFAGGKRKGILGAAEAGVRVAAAQAQQVLDSIAYEVNVAFRGVEDAEERIKASKVVMDQARENARLVASRARAGDATPAETIEAQAGEIRSEQSFFAATYLYQRALARLEYAVGTSVPVGPGSIRETTATAPAEPKPEPLPKPPDSSSPFDRQSRPGSLPDLPPPPDLGGAAPVRTAPLQSPTSPATSDNPRLTPPPSLSRPPYEANSPLGGKP